MDKENEVPGVQLGVVKKKQFKFKRLPAEFMGSSVEDVASPRKPLSEIDANRKAVVKAPMDGVPDNVGSRGFVGKALDSDSSDDENDESRRVRKELEAERLRKNPEFDPFDPKFYKIQYTKSGKPYAKSTKPYWAWAANTYGYLRSKTPAKKRVKKDDVELSHGKDDSDSDKEDELGLHTIAFPLTVKSMKDDIASELSKDGKFDKSVNEVWRERYYIELPYCRWCDTRPCACYV